MWTHDLLEKLLELQCSYSPKDYLSILKDVDGDFQIHLTERDVKGRIVLDREKAKELAVAILKAL